MEESNTVEDEQYIQALEALKEALREQRVVETGAQKELGEFFEILSGNDHTAIEQAIKERMASNLEFFEKAFPELLQGIMTAPKDYNLLFDEKGLNIINLHDGSLMFPEIDHRYTMVEAAKNLAQSPLTHPQWKLYTNDLKITLLDREKFPLTAKMFNALCEAAIDIGVLKDGMHLPSYFLPTVTLLGLGGGLVLEALRERYEYIHALLIFEESMDLFRISCYFVDYPALFAQVPDKACFLFIESLMDPKNIVSFFEDRKITSNFLRLELMLYNTPKLQGAKDIIYGAYSANARGWGTFDDEFIGLRNSLANMECYKSAKGNYHLKHPFFYNAKPLPAPICVVGNGPSLDALLPFIKENADRMIIFSSGTAIKPLLNYGIKPDFQFEIERVDYLHTAFEGLDLKGITLICANLVDPRVLELFDEVFLFSRDGSSAAEIHAPKNRLLGASPFVGNASFSLAAMVGSDVLLCGLDCGYIIGASKHAKGSFYGEEALIKEKEALPPDTFPVKPNKDKEVYSDALFLNSRENIEGVSKIFRPNTIVNLGEGAYIDGSMSLNVDEFTLKKINKKGALRTFKRFFTKDTHQAFFKPIERYYLDDGKEFFKSLESMFMAEVKTKKDLFIFLDKASHQIIYMKRVNSYWGILMGGSVAFYLQILMVCALGIPKDDIEVFFNKAQQIFFKELGSFKIKHKFLLQKHAPKGISGD